MDGGVGELVYDFEDVGEGPGVVEGEQPGDPVL